MEKTIKFAGENPDDMYFPIGIQTFKGYSILSLLLLSLFFAACERYPRESERIAAAFEQAQAVYGEGENDTLLFIPELDKASAYYARKNDYGKAAMAALYHGYAEKDYDRTAAMTAFKNAEQYGELVHDSLTMARAQYQMGRMLYYDGMNEEALERFIKSEAFFGCHYDDKALALNALACSYLILKDYLKADSCLNKSLFYANFGVADDVTQKVLNNHALLYQLLGEYEKAKECLKTVKPKNKQQAIMNQLNLGDLFMVTGAYDSAAYYFHLAEESIYDQDVREETKVAAYELFSRLAENRKDYSLALKYNKLHDKLRYKIQEKRRLSSVYYIQKKYDYETMENQIKIEKIHNLRNLLLFVLLLFISIVVILTLVFRHISMRRKEQQLEAELDQIKHNLQTAVDNSNIEKELLWRLRLLLKTKQIIDGSQPTKAKQEMMKQFIMQGEGSLYDAAMTIINEAYPQLQATLQDQYPNMNETEIKVCLLSIKGLSNSDISEILGVSVHTVNKNKSSLYKKMGVEFNSFKTKIEELKSPF